MIADVVHLLACPVCRAGLSPRQATLRCPNGHSFDVARQGYVNLLTATAPGTGDTAAMVAARERFLGDGHYAPIRQLVGDHALAFSPRAPEAFVDVGSGPGWYLAGLLQRAPAGPAGGGPVGLALDLSVYAARRAARAHPRMGAVVSDTWRSLPLRDGGSDVVLDVFAPRNPPELRRVLRPGGVLVVVTPAPEHLEELRRELGLLGVEEGKEERLAQSLSASFDLVAEDRLTFAVCLSRADAAALVAMGPSAWHGEPSSDVERLAEPVEVTASVRVATYRRRG